VARDMKDCLLNEALWGIFYSLSGTKNAHDSQCRLDELLLIGQGIQSAGTGAQVVVSQNPLIQALIRAVEPKFEPVYQVCAQTGRVSYTGEFRLSVLENKEFSYTKNIRIPALKALGELVSAEQRHYTDVCILSGVLPAVLKMLKHVKYAQARKEGCWLVSNLLAAVPDQVMASIAPYDVGYASNMAPLLTYKRIRERHPEVDECE